MFASKVSFVKMFYFIRKEEREGAVVGIYIRGYPRISGDTSQGIPGHPRISGYDSTLGYPCCVGTGDP